MNRKWKIIVAIVAALIVLLVLWLIIIRFFPATDEPVAPQGVGLQTESAGQLEASGGMPARTDVEFATLPPPPPPPDIAIRQVAVTFAERYGSYSSDGDFVNIEDLAPLITPQFSYMLAAFVEGRRAEAGTDAGSGGFRAVTSRAVTTDVTLSDETHARARVVVKRTESGEHDDGDAYLQVLILGIEREGDAWLVSDAEWGGKL